MKMPFILYILLILSIATFFPTGCSNEGTDKDISEDAKHTDVDLNDVKDILDCGIKDESEIEDSEINDILADISSDISGDPEEDATNDILIDAGEDITDIYDSGIADIITDDTILDIITSDTTSDIYQDTIEDASFEDTMDVNTTDTGILQPVINELMIIPNYSDVELGQYVEIYNPNESGIDINGYKLKTNNKEFVISNQDCDTVINAHSYMVIGATKDSSKNSYAKVKCEWKDRFTLTDATYLELLRSDNVLSAKIDISTLNIVKGSSLEKIQNNFVPSPSLITFLDDTGLYKGDRGSPNKPNYDLIIKEQLQESSTLSDRIENENSVHRYPAYLAEGDIIAFYADVDRLNGDLKLFASLLDKNGGFIVPDNYISDITYDFFIYHMIKNTDLYYFQIQPDFFSTFVPANIEAKYFRADGIKINKDFVEIKIGDQYQIETSATFSQNKDLKDYPIDKTLLKYSSNDPNIADVSNDGVITAKNIGSVTLYISYYYLNDKSLDTSMVVNVYNQATNETCETAIDATNGINTYASTIGTNDDYNPEVCVFSSFSGGDIVYYVDADKDAEYTIIVTPYESFDPMIYVLDDCSSNVCIYGSVLNGAGEPEKLTFKNKTLSIKRYYIVIDGELTDNGTFLLEISKK